MGPLLPDEEEAGLLVGRHAVPCFDGSVAQNAVLMLHNVVLRYRASVCERWVAYLGTLACSGSTMAPKQMTIEETIGTKRQREEGEEAQKEEHATNDGAATEQDAAKEETTADQAPEPKQQKLSPAPKSVLEEGRIYFYYR